MPPTKLFVTNNNNNKTIQGKRAARNARKGPLKAAVTALPAGGFLVKHSEYCGVVDLKTCKSAQRSSTSGTKSVFTPMQLPLNPGEGITFPWLTGIASRFEKYHFRMLRFRYVPTTGALFTGAVSLCPIYDPSERVPTDRRALYNAEGAVQQAIYKPATLTVPKGRLQEERFVRLTHAATMDPNELRLSDIGFLVVALMDVDSTPSSTHAYGNLFVDYEVELIAPRVGERTPKCAHYAAHDINHTSVTTRYPPLFGDPLEPNKRDYALGGPAAHNPNSTLGLEHTVHYGEYEELATGKPVDTNVFEFKEPFSGLLQVTHHNDGAGYVPEIWVNGVNDSGFKDRWDLVGTEHPIKHPLVDRIHKITDGVAHTVATFKIVAEAGEAVAIGLRNAVTTVAGMAEVLFTETGPELLALMGLP